MLKFLLAASVIVAFIVYALHPNFGGDEVNVVPPQNSSLTLQPSPTPIASAPPNTNNQMMQGNTMMGVFKDGTYTGSVADAYYGNVQVQAVISGGKITDVIFLQYPNDRRNSIAINTQAMPYLTQEAIAVQNAQVDTISGATQTSRAFRESLQSALDQAK